MKEYEVLSFASKWMELENIILNEDSQFRKSKIAVFPHIDPIQIGAILCKTGYAEGRSHTREGG
jgi:hypothetical protein